MVYNDWRQSGLLRCILCGGGAEPRFGVCEGCARDLLLIETACRTCAMPLPPAPAGRSRQCPSCLSRPPACTATRCAWHYGFPVSQLIQHFKYEGDLAAGHSLATLAAETLADMAGSLDLLIPIPLHWRRYWQRGFNQAQLVAETLGNAWQLPVLTRGLRKCHASERQQSLDKKQRLRNLSGSFAVRAAVEGRRVGLVDDVITTGATMEAAAGALLEAGAAQISAIALARTP
ncbi:ComF family protein [Microbulbifer flavimaris]|uniref:ComF family protein n=1 Tax=Microbulbifer flavimaris TaxID=1781068 RepID=A0ABX4HYW1_9GAMM|nr:MULTISPECIES: ComF family protein [Microbulbifer]KUJ82811.1 phosphoribosyltransferase [Microbulbifer sp. ZGT114]PCO04988.1 ComF family protein [Microbulbifer flavimaris]